MSLQRNSLTWLACYFDLKLILHNHQMYWYMFLKCFQFEQPRTRAFKDFTFWIDKLSGQRF